MEYEKVDLLATTNELNIDEEALVQFSEIIKWGKFVAVATIVILSIFVVIVSVIILDHPGINFHLGLYAINSFWVWGMIFIITILEAILLFRFSTMSQSALADNNIMLFNRSLESLKFFFIISGILGAIACITTIMSKIS